MPFRVSGVSLRGLGDIGQHMAWSAWQVGAQGQGVITALCVVTIGTNFSSDSSL